MDIANIGLLGAFLGGLISFLSPCTLPLVPGYLSFVTATGQSNPQNQQESWPHLLLSVFFILGFTIVFISLGASITVVGGMLQQYRYEATLIGGSLIIVLGVFMTGLIRINVLQREFRLHLTPRSSNPTTAFLLGISFAIGWTPCIGPILATILAMSSLSGDPQQGVLLLSVYSLGLALPFLIVSIFMESFKKRLRALGRFSRYLHIAAGLIMILMGVAMITGKLTLMASWMLNWFPALGKIG
ncbi:cytochrome c biogenesis CcdA family protein [Saccharospirillum alexandrii]|uniref:cytochrome c biogenesis CcdA family protein n=1 Tax=Saccharospirillum alexandrii TaxID=2448477 RepID=UPI000FD8F157|nr:cytochrome c biogenesis protein CcdA [Saccharospirillum alexandrii]